MKIDHILKNIRDQRGREESDREQLRRFIEKRAEEIGYEEAAKLSGTARNTLYAYARGNVRVSREVLAVIAQKLK